MATLSSAAAIAACNAIVDRLDLPGGAGSGTGRMIVTTGADGAGTVLATIALATTAFGAASDTGAEATATLAGVPLSDTSADNTGTAAGFALQSDSGGTPTNVITGSVATSGGDIDIDNTSIVAGQTVNLTALTVSVPEASA
jgi:hypothetical protein